MAHGSAETSDAIETAPDGRITAPLAPEDKAGDGTAPVVDSPPTSPQQPGPAQPNSPWWTAPGGKAVDIPAFGRTLLDQILAIFFPAPQPIPVRIRARR
jgi:hypothetical protein